MKQSKHKIIGWHTLFSFGLAVALMQLGGGVSWAQSGQAKGIDGDSPAQRKPLLAEKSAAVASEVDAQLQLLIKEASSAQSAGKLNQAAKLWVELLDGDVDAVVRCRSHFSAGLCYSQLRDFEPSIAHFKKGLEVATPEVAAEVPQAMFYLGYGQLELGRSLQAMAIGFLADEKSKSQKKRAMELLTTSSQTLGRLQRRFPSFAGADQAAFFQGKAFELLGRLEEAAESYRKVLAVDRSTFAADARFGLADSLQKLGQATESLEQYRLLITGADQLSPQQKPLLVESQFRAAEVLMSLGDARRDSGDAESAADDFALAFELYSSVADQNENTQLVPLALYGAAWSQLNAAVGQSQPAVAQDAEKWFTRLIENWPDHELIADATTGRKSAQQLAEQLGAQLAESSKESTADEKVESKPEPADMVARADVSEDARLELGLARVTEAKWNEAIEVFDQLIADFPDSTQLNRYRYELAWALKSATPARANAALDQFAAIVESTTDDSLVAEAHFHLGSADYDLGQYESASQHFVDVLESELPTKVIERASYQLGWSEYRQENYSDSAKQFRQHLDAFPNGPMATDAKVMFAESQFQQDKHADALAAYRVAKPAVDAAGNIDPKMQMLTALHGAQSANESQQYKEAIRFAKPVTEADVSKAYQADAWLEIGIAQDRQGNQSLAIDAWQKAVASMSVTGARARSLLGESLARQGQYQDALNQFKLVYFGFGGVEAEDDVRPWQAYALYEAARLNQSLCREAAGPVLRQRIDEAMAQYQRLLEVYGESDLADEAQRQLTKLEKF